MKKRTLSFMLVLCMVLALLPGAAFAARGGFTITNGVLTQYNGPGGDVVIPDSVASIEMSAFSDVPGSAWYADAVAWAVKNNITNGTSATTFSPDKACTQGEILTFLWRARGEPRPAGTVSGSQYYASAAQWAREQGLTDNSFSADAPCTRAMVVTYLWKLAGSPAAGAPNFTDVAANAAYAQAVTWAVAQGITNGTSTTAFSPSTTCSRGQIVTFLYRAFTDNALEPAAPGTSVQTSMADELLALINAERSKAGVQPLTTAANLTQAAQTRSQEISRGYIDDRPDGSGWETVLNQYNVAASYVDETMLYTNGDAAGVLATIMNTPGAYAAMLSGESTQVGIGYTGVVSAAGEQQYYWSLLYITPPAGSTSGWDPGNVSGGNPDVSFTPVPMKELANLKSLRKSATDEQLAQAYAVALEIVRPLAGLPMEEQLQGIAAAVRARFDSGMEYSMSSAHYNDPYGYFILGSASCAGCTRATGLCLNILGIPYEHVNENQYSHQWCRVNVNGTYWICDAYGLYCGPEPAPYTHPFVF